MKRVITLGLGLLLLLGGCGSKVQEKQLDFNKLMKSIDDTYVDTIMVELGDSDVYDMFDLNSSQLKQLSYRMAFLDTKADEIVMFQVSDLSLVDQIQSRLQKRVEELRAEFVEYIPAQKELVDHSIVFVDGSYVFLIVHPQAAAIQDDIIALLQGE